MRRPAEWASPQRPHTGISTARKICSLPSPRKASGNSPLLKAAVDDREPLIGVGLAYVEFAMQNRGLFRLMFSTLLADRAKYPTLNEAANEAFGFLQQVVTGVEGGLQDENPAMLAAWGPVHGLSALFIDGLVPESQARSMAEQILARSGPIWAESASSLQ